MSERRNSLSPPARTGTEDPGAHELDTSDSDEHFSDAHSGPADSRLHSPVPRTRVEKVDDAPSYGEIPGTAAYRLRMQDAEPDEIAIVKGTSEPASAAFVTPTPPGGQPIPMTVVEETPDAPGSVRHAEIEDKHRADPPPDLVLKADEKAADLEGATTEIQSPTLDTPYPAQSVRNFSTALTSPVTPAAPGESESEDEGDFADDFDDFEEGDQEEDFEDFHGFTQQDSPSAPPTASTGPPLSLPSTTSTLPLPPLSIPIPDFSHLDLASLLTITEPYLDALFPPSDAADIPPFSSRDHPVFLTSRSASLWSQLVAPPPLQPPDWIRSRIRRLFLVSLGVPVDLDEILPASKQKKLVLPSAQPDSSRTSTDARSGTARLRAGEANASTTSLDSQGNPKRHLDETSQPRKGPTPAPDLDIVAAKQLCTTTDEALRGMTDDELNAHIGKLEALEGRAKETLDYWQKRTDEKIGDREAFEGVIENLVKHARKVRK